MSRSLRAADTSSGVETGCYGTHIGVIASSRRERGNLIRFTLTLATFVLAAAMVYGGDVLAAAPLGDINTIFNEGCDLYEQGEFDSAVEHFESLTARGVRSTEVYYNLGNCYYKQGHVGKAVASYRRSAMLSPRDGDIETNLDLLRSVVGFRDTTTSYDLGGVATLPLRLASPRELQAIFYVAYYLTAVCFMCVFLLKADLRRRSLHILIVLLVVTLGVFGLARYGASKFGGGSDGVVIADKAELMSGPGMAFDELARLPDGVEVRLRVTSGIWIEVELSTGDIGWIREKDIERI